MASKIVNGQLKSAFAKLAALHAKNVFSFAIVTGNLFAKGEEDDELTALLDGSIEIACPTYFTVGTTPLPPRVVQKIEADDEITPNLHYLGKRSVTKTSEGVRIVALGGVLDTNIVAGQSKDQHEPFHTESDAKTLKGAHDADILLTAMWPSEIFKNSPKARELQIDATTAPSSPSIAELCAELNPRYHFAMSPGEFAFEREPFFPEAKEGGDDKGIALTRFISLASWGNASKAKSMYAFAVNRDTIVTPPPGSTLTPFFKPGPKRKRNADEAGFARFDQGHNGRDGRDGRHHKNRRGGPPLPLPGPDQCYFCLSNPNFATHMVASIAEDTYLATAKGPLPAADTWKKHGIDFPCHLILTPQAHAPSLSNAAMGEAGAGRTFKEMTRLRESLQGMVSSKSGRKLGAVTWEINRSRNIHVHWQFMPVPADMVIKETVEKGFRVLATDSRLGDFKPKEFGMADEVEGDYLRVWIWAEEEGEEGGRVVGKSLLMRLDENVRFDLQFPRKVMAKLLGLEDRTFWQDVGQTEEEETADVKAFSAAFKEWDFTVESQS
ncbi:CwfJ C-terminus 2-domain-containing protein-like protein [Schizothecium vesticola]|uniref:CwfJ C-terminus 2-domain-containing protein-like protein n=1 Tax=Schizothecium vesticola TaxID=314040 RepID=A0AA40KAD5_9PEZI|nr:CwfJ C-terminus 2-domain-containing protein-like protein [Schizothecium vesticola]